MRVVRNVRKSLLSTLLEDTLILKGLAQFVI
ncbi:hypothetical protein LCGC14_2880110, partial [marine sediment metagenome]